MSGHQLYWVGQKAFIEKDGNVLVLTDANGEGLDYPGGRIEDDEVDLKESLMREVREEVGLEIEIGTPFAVWHNTFPKHHINAGKKVYLVGFKCKYLSGEIKLSNEHDEFKWVSKENYKEVNDGTDYFNYLKQYFENQ